MSIMRSGSYQEYAICQQNTFLMQNTLIFARKKGRKEEKRQSILKDVLSQGAFETYKELLWRPRNQLVSSQ